jgi:hypothetical protein
MSGVAGALGRCHWLVEPWHFCLHMQETRNIFAFPRSQNALLGCWAAGLLASTLQAALPISAVEQRLLTGKALVRAVQHAALASHCSTQEFGRAHLTEAPRSSTDRPARSRCQRFLR